MGNSINSSSLKKIANNTKNTDNNNDDEKKSNDTKQTKSTTNSSKEIKIPEDINYDDLPFEEKTHYALLSIDIKDKLSVIGYFRKEAELLNRSNIEIPRGIINYVIMYLYFCDEKDLFLGNLHKNVAAAHNTHAWTMFISSSNKELIAPKSIEKVIYYLHPTFHPSERTKKEAPYFLSTRGWGTFDVEAKIIFKKKYNRKDCFAVHELDFDNWASTTKVDLKQDKKISQDYNLWHSSGDRDMAFFKKKEDYKVDEKYEMIFM